MFSSLRSKLLQAYIRAPEHPAKYRIIRWLGTHVFPEQGIHCRVYPDASLLLHPRDWIEYLMLRGERYEPMTLDFVASNLRDGDVAVLAGVNMGLHVIVAARSVGDNGLVVGIEPQPRTLLRAARNLRLNGLQGRTKLLSAALGSREGLVSMAWANPDNPGAASLFDKGEGLTVCLVRLSQVLDSLAPRRPRLLLLDVQGFEAAALAGLDERNLPDILVVEMDLEFLGRAKVAPRTLLQTIVEMGYSIHALDGAPASLDQEAFPERNVVCVRRDAAASWTTPTRK